MAMYRIKSKLKNAMKGIGNQMNDGTSKKKGHKSVLDPEALPRIIEEDKDILSHFNDINPK